MKREFRYFLPNGLQVLPTGEHYKTYKRVWQLRELGMECPGLPQNKELWVAWLKSEDKLPEKERTYEILRVIEYKTNGSNHVCDSRCMGAKGGNCECSCGGKNHGINR